MAVQDRLNVTTVPFIRSGESLVREADTIAQDAGRSAVLAPFTLMAKVAASGKWTPFILETATNGTALPQGVYMGDEIAAATLVAGDVIDVPILVGNAVIDTEQLVIEAAKTLATIIGATVEQRTVQDELARRGIFVESTVDIDSFENA